MAESEYNFDLTDKAAAPVVIPLRGKRYARFQLDLGGQGVIGGGVISIGGRVTPSMAYREIGTISGAGLADALDVLGLSDLQLHVKTASTTTGLQGRVVWSLVDAAFAA